jgi:DNA-binding NarL/FixJ family response regulator
MAKRLLIVDDEPKLLRAVAVTLRAENYIVITARNGAEALVSINQSIPDLVISDVRMPGMSGYHLARVLRSNARTELIPIVFLTAKDEREDRLAGFRIGVDAYLTKPFDPEELLIIIGSILNRIERTGAELARIVGSVKGEETGASSADQRHHFDEDLTESESRMARFVADGKSNKEIAAELSISVRTVEGHISNILSKKGWSNRVEIARYVLGRGNNNNVAE